MLNQLSYTHVLMANIRGQLKKLTTRILRKVNRRITSYSSINFGRNLLGLKEYFEHIWEKTGTQGCIVELGFGYGSTFLILADIAEKSGVRIFGFDSFKGFPEPSKFDASLRNPKRGEWSHRSYLEANRQLEEFGFSSSFILKDVELLEGFVEDTLKDFSPPPISLVHVDLDLGSGYDIALRTLWPFLMEKGIVCFDEYADPKWPGATQVIDTFCAMHNLEIQKDICGKFYIQKVSGSIL